MGPLFKLLEASFELFIPLVVAGIIDNGISNGDTPYIIKMCLVMVALGVIGLVCSLSAQFFSAKAAVGFAAKVRMALFCHIQKLSYSELDGVGTSTIITRMTADINQLQNGVNMTLRLFLRSPFIVFGAMIMAFTIDVKAALIFAVVIPILSIVIYGIMLITIPLNRKSQANLDTVLSDTRDNINGVRVIRAFGQEKREIEKFDRDNELLVRSQIVAGRIAGLTDPITFVIINFGIVFLMWSGALQVDSGVITNGQLVALVNYMSQILVELIKLANFIVLDIKALASASRLEALFKLESSMKDGNEKLSGDRHIEDIEFNDVSFAYNGAGDKALSHISFKLRKGQTLGIIGGTGSGKSSLINMIPRFYDASEGSISIDGGNIRDYEVLSLREHIGVVPQKAVLFKGSIRDNMKWGNKNASDESIWNALKVACADEFVSEKDGQLDFMLTQGGKNLSGGQRQRLTIARAIVKHPDVLILDDSSSALDNLTDKRLRANLKNLGAMITIIVSQRASSVMGADNIIVLDDGQIAGQGSHEQLMEKCDIYREIYDSQFDTEVAKA